MKYRGGECTRRERSARRGVWQRKEEKDGKKEKEKEKEKEDGIIKGKKRNSRDKNGRSIRVKSQGNNRPLPPPRVKKYYILIFLTHLNGTN